MAEISREEAIESLNFLISEKSNQTPVDYILQIDRAISDMEKLQKIEHIICDVGECEELEDTIAEKVEKHCGYHKGDCYRCMFERIDKILKEVE